MELTTRQFKALRDMADGHLTLYAGCDRPDIFDRDWWKPLLGAGLIAPSPSTATSPSPPTAEQKE